VTFFDNKPKPGDDKETKQIGELLSAILSTKALPPASPEIERQQVPGVEQSFLPATEIRKLFNSGDVALALKEARTLYEVRRDTFSENAQVTVEALGALFEYATRARASMTDLHEQLHALEKHWTTSAGHERDAEDIASLSNPSLFCSSSEIDAVSGTRPYVMRTLPRVCEYLAQTSRENSVLRGYAERSLRYLHQLYPLFDDQGERGIMKQDAAAAMIRSAAHIAAWKQREERPDLREVRYIAECSRDRLAEFSTPVAEFNFALFQFESGRREAGLQTLESLVEAPQGVSTDVRIAALDQLTGWYIRLKEFDNARASLASFREALQNDSANAASEMKHNLRVRTHEALRLQAYEKALDDGPQG